VWLFCTAKSAVRDHTEAYGNGGYRPVVPEPFSAGLLSMTFV
jgi:hypothetical protein